MQTLEVIPESPDVDTLESAEPLQLAFAPAQTLLAKWQEKADSLTVTREDQITEMKQARLARLELKEARVTLDKTRKKLKEKALARCQKIDEIAREITKAFEMLEGRLLESEQFAARAEEARINKLADERKTALLQYNTAIPAGLGEMPEPQFADMLEGARLVHEAKIERERLAEEARLAQIEADRVERERIQAENAHLKAEAEAKEKQLAEERRLAKIEADRIAAEAKAEREAAEKKLADERRKAEEAAAIERKAAQAKLAEEKQKADAAAAKLKAEAAERERIIQSRAIEAQRIADEATRAQAAKVAALQRAEADRLAKVAKQEAAGKKAAADAAKAPDKKKLATFAAEVRALALPAIADANASELLATTRERFAAFVESLAAKL